MVGPIGRGNHIARHPIKRRQYQLCQRSAGSNACQRSSRNHRANPPFRNAEACARPRTSTTAESAHQSQEARFVVISVMPNTALVSVVSAPPRSLTMISTEMLFEQHLANADQSIEPSAPALPSPVADQISVPTEPASPEVSSILAQPQDLKSQANPDIRVIRKSITKTEKMHIPVEDEMQLTERIMPSPHKLDVLAPIVIAVGDSSNPAAMQTPPKDAMPISATKSSAVPSGEKDGTLDESLGSRATPDFLMHLPGGGRSETRAVSAMEFPSLSPTQALDLCHSGWFEQVARNIVDAKSKGGALMFRLMPPNLGSLEIQLTRHESGLAIEMRTSNENAAQIIASAEPRLTDELRQRGVTISESSVQSGASGDGRHARSAPNPEQLPPFRETEQISHPDEDQRDGRPADRFA
ncbi:flagellar hook-length control protein FliK [Sphingorhabdus pulchriflava]|uniref:flagellar hook-length control protein FliK n=1 Tax=Sphingorhabdus pulchriflava TaxID=2292257 RepID=UPI0015F18276|nr:flagellar hook-length control protein FliK [Sphingorhabdus pulchriflava]